MIGVTYTAPKQQIKDEVLRTKAYSLLGGSIILILVFHFFFTTGFELIWDRYIVFGTAVVTLAFQYSQLPHVWKDRIISVTSYIFTIQLLSVIILNHYNIFYVLCILFALQGIGYSKRSLRQALVYLCLGTTTFIFGALLDEIINHQYRTLMVVYILVSTIVNTLLILVKHRYRQRIKLSEGLMRTIVSKTEQAIFLTDFEGNIVEHNDRTCEMFGYQMGELNGVNFSELRVEQLSEEEDSKGVVRILENKFWKADKELLKADGSIFTGHVTINWVKRHENEYLIYRVDDITERKKAEAELIAAKNTAEEASLSKSDFLATMSHEIRTPLNGVIGTSQILDTINKNPEQKEQIDILRRSSLHLLDIINDILDFSKVESGRMVFEYHAFNLPDLLTETLESVSSIAQKKQVDINLILRSNVPHTIVADRLRIKQVLTNLLSNAIKFSPFGKVEIEASFSDEWIENGLSLKVKDNGIGIPESSLPSIFESFKQLDGSTTRNFGGTGLGLAICKQLATNMNGDVLVESVLGDGSTFNFLVPVQIAEQSSLEKTDKKEDVIKDFSGMQVLVVEDNEINQKVVGHILGQFGVVPDLACNGYEAVDKAKENTYNLILMDLQMPRMDGYEACSRIQASLGDRVPTIVAMTANVLDSDRQACLNAGMDGFLSKPVLMEDMQRILQSVKKTKV